MKLINFVSEIYSSFAFLIKLFHLIFFCFYLEINFFKNYNFGIKSGTRKSLVKPNFCPEVDKWIYKGESLADF